MVRQAILKEPIGAGFQLVGCGFPLLLLCIALHQDSVRIRSSDNYTMNWICSGEAEYCCECFVLAVRSIVEGKVG